MSGQFKINARLHQIINVHRANNEIIFVSADRLPEEFRALRSKRLTLLVSEPNGHPTQTALSLPVVEEVKPEPMVIRIPGQPFTKPTLTPYDIENETPAYLGHRGNEKRAQKAAEGKIPEDITSAEFKFYFSCPLSWDVKKRLQYDGKPHFAEPRIGKLIAAYSDALLINSQIIATVTAQKFWVNSEGYAEVTFLP